MTLERNKNWGREVENQGKARLAALWPDIDRTGASNQKEKDDPDLVAKGPDPVLLVVTKEKGAGKPLAVTLGLEDLILLTTFGVGNRGVAVQVKGRQEIWVDGLLAKLKEAARRSRWQYLFHDPHLASTSEGITHTYRTITNEERAA